MALKRCVCLLLALFLCVAIPVPVFSKAPQVSAQAAVLYEPVSDTFLYRKNADTVRPMASTTKIMTALLAYESGKTAEPVEILPEMIDVEGSSMGLSAGDILTLGALADGMLAASGNDAANAIAIFLAGDLPSFATKMNARATELGMNRTGFVTPSGLDAPGHETTAEDLARLAAEAMGCAAFANAVGQKQMRVDYLYPEKTVQFENHNRLLQMVEGCEGIKTGYTDLAGRCLVTAVMRNGIRLICVTLNAPDDWNDHSALYDYGFQQVEAQSLEAVLPKVQIPVADAVNRAAICAYSEIPVVPSCGEPELSIRLCIPHFLYAPVQVGEIVGRAEVYIQEKKYAEIPICIGGFTE